MFKIKKSGVLGTRKLKSMHISLRLARFICIFGQQNCIVHENSKDTLTTAGNIFQWRPLEIGITNQALECTLVVSPSLVSRYCEGYSFL